MLCQWLFRFFIILLFSGLFLGLTQSVYANENFHTTLETTYTVSLSGTTTVTHIIKLTNKTPTLYARQYGLKISSPSLTNVQVKNNGQPLTAEVVTTSTQTSIGISFPDQMVGEGKTRTLEISYQNPDTTVISGQVLEVLVPQLGSASEYDEYQVTLVTPHRFGAANRMTPTVYSLSQNESGIVTVFKPQAGESVTVLFGTQQIFDLGLTYHLQNTGPNPGLAQIALPPDTRYQKVAYQGLEPRPQQLASDRDGNWIATYEVPPQSTVEVKATLQALITLNPVSTRLITDPIPTYTKSQPYWQSDDGGIKELASQYSQPKDIYSYVVNTLNYNYERLNQSVERLGAVEVLAHPDQANCQEFTDVFVAMSRAANIPARRLTGYAHTQNSVLRPLSLVEDVLHAWPEYYDTQKQAWVPIDPTWGNTTGGINYFDQFDLNHIVFAINGESSELPYPAGSYKIEDTNSKDVQVEFGKDFPQIASDFTFEIKPKKLLGFLDIPGYYELVITNNSGVAWYDLQLHVRHEGESVSLSRSDFQLTQVLPYQRLTLPLTVLSTQDLVSVPATLQLEGSYANDQEGITDLRGTLEAREFPVRAGGQIVSTLNQPPLYLAVGGIGLGCTFIAGGILVYRRKR